jgi:periplasmic protein TonB
MQAAVDDVLSERRRRERRSGAASLVAAAALHLAVAGAVFLAPRLRAAPRELPEYVAVRIVPAQALGVEKPPPPRPEPAPPRPPPAEPEPPAPEPPPPAEPAMPPPEKPSEKPPRPEPRPEPAAPAAAGPQARQGSPEGSPLATSAFGTAVAGLDNPDFTYGYYIDQMLSLIRAQWVRPPLGGGIEATVHFQVGRDGRIDDVRIVQSSGYSSFDLAGLRAVQSASPLPPLPRSYRQDSLGVTLIIR